MRAHAGWPVTFWQNRVPLASVSSPWRRAMPKSRSMSLIPASLWKVNRMPSSARVPRFVVIVMTPLPARAPYSDAAAAPFTTSTFSMSFGLISGRLPLMITPSTM